jgi:hypothetical protein
MNLDEATRRIVELEKQRDDWRETSRIFAEQADENGAQLQRMRPVVEAVSAYVAVGDDANLPVQRDNDLWQAVEDAVAAYESSQPSTQPDSTLVPVEIDFEPAHSSTTEHAREQLIEAIARAIFPVARDAVGVEPLVRESRKKAEFCSASPL